MPETKELYEQVFAPEKNDVDIRSLIKKAKGVLDKNWRDTFTEPSINLYPHQWSWDSAFIAIGYSHYNQQRAQQELKRLFSAQWSNGMVPHIAFNREATEGEYFPGPKFWDTHRTSVAPKEPAGSGVCQPPIHATAVLLMLENCKDRKKAMDFAREIYPKLKAWHDFLYRERDPKNDGLVYIRHPWASGMDNSPTWDKVLENMQPYDSEMPEYERTDVDGEESREERPSDFSYDRYVRLLAFFKERDYNEYKIREDGCPFMVESVLFNSILCRAGRDLAIIAEWMGEDPTPFHHQSNRTAKAINKKLWDEESNIYLDYDLVGDERIEDHSLAGFLPLYAQIPSPARAQKMFEYLDTGSFCELGGDCLALPSYDRRQSEFNSKKYWRGPIWINLNWMLYHGLKRYGHPKYDLFIKKSIIYLAALTGFHEYYDPVTGEGYGEENFSWSAALFLDLINLKRYQTGDFEEDHIG